MDHTPNDTRLEDLTRQHVQSYRLVAKQHARNGYEWPCLDSATLTERPMRLEAAIPLVNKVAWCYFVPLSTTPGATTVNPPQSRGWISEGIGVWESLLSEDDKQDVVLPFACVNLAEGDMTRAAAWMDLPPGGDSSLEDRATAREKHIDTLIFRNRVISDIVSERVRARSEEDDYLERYGDTYEQYGDPGLVWPWSSFIPTCRAVFLIVSPELLASKTAILVLTGNNEHLCAGAPTFSDIPASDVLRAHGLRAVEVTLDSAIRFLACIYIAELEANQELKHATNLRRFRIEQYARSEAEEAV